MKSADTTAPRLALLSPLRARNYLLLWASSAVAVVGENFLFVALSALALDLTHRPSGWGTVLTIQAVPQTLLMLGGGVATDRFRPRSVMLLSSYLLALVVGALAALAGAGALQAWHLYGYAVASGTVYAFSIPATNSIIPELLPSDQVRSANALSQVTLNLGRVLAPPIAGALVAQSGSTLALAANAVAFLVSGAFLWLIRGTPRERRPAAKPLEEIRDGLRVVRRDAVVGLTIVMGMVGFFGFGGAILVGLPALAALVLGTGGQGIGLLYGAAGAGALLGALVAGGVPDLRRPGVVGCLALVAAGALLAMAGVAPSAGAVAPFLFLSGACLAACAIIFLSLIQTRTPPDVRGRVMSLFTLGLFGLSPLSFGLAGLAGDALGPRGVIVLGGAFVLLAGAIGLSRKAVRSVA